MFAAFRFGRETKIAGGVAILSAILVATSVALTAFAGAPYGLLWGGVIGVASAAIAYAVARAASSSHGGPPSIETDTGVPLESKDEPGPWQHGMHPLHPTGDLDPLTGLVTKRIFFALTEDAIPCFKRYGWTIGIIRIDIDGFDELRKTLGEDGADKVISHVADVLTLPIRITDRASRFEGPCFALFVREIDEHNAVALAERIRESLIALPFRYEDKSVSLTITAGVAIVSRADRDMQALISRADRAVGDAKKRGGNCTQGYTSETRVESVP